MEHVLFVFQKSSRFPTLFVSTDFIQNCADDGRQLIGDDSGQLLPDFVDDYVQCRREPLFSDRFSLDMLYEVKVSSEEAGAHLDLRTERIRALRRSATAGST